MTKCAVRFIITITNKRFERQLIVYEKLTAIVMAVFLLYSGYVFGTVSAADEIYTTRTVTVYSGDTMWDIASRWAEDDEDVRAVIYRICEANGLQNTDLQPGQKIMVPVRVHAGEGVMLAEATNGNL